MIQALNELEISGIKTNKPLLQAILSSKRFLKGKKSVTESYLTSLVNSMRIDGSLSEKDVAKLILQVVDTVETGNTKPSEINQQFGGMNKNLTVLKAKENNWTSQIDNSLIHHRVYKQHKE